MSAGLTPRLDVLPPPQRRLWPDLRAAPGLGYVLYGGTAIALRLGHRASIDFDFFSDRSLDRATLLAGLPFLGQATVVQDAQDAWSALVDRDLDESWPTPVMVSFLGGLDIGRVGTPDWTDDGVLQIASVNDLLATKLKVLLQRAEVKDYLDILALLRAGADLASGLAGARALYGSTFQPSESLKALTFFGDGDLDLLAEEDRADLVEAAGSVSDLPGVLHRSRRLAAD